MKITIISMRFLPTVGGGETIVYDQASSLAKLGHNVSVITEEAEGVTYKDSPEDFEIIRLHAINNITAGNLNLATGLYELATIIRKIDPDIIHVHNYQTAIATFLTTSNLRAKVVFTQYATPIPESQKVIGYLGDFEYEKSLAQFCYRASRCDMIVEISDVYLKWALECGADRSKARKLYPGVDAVLWKPRPPDKALKDRLGLKPSDKVVFAPIRFAERKGILDFLESARYIKDPEVRLLVCGVFVKADPTIKQRIEELLREKSVRDKVIIQSEGVSLGELPNYFSIADLVCLPSHLEGLGVVLLEAMAMKVPVLATSVPGISEIVTDGVTGTMVEPHNPKALATAIQGTLEKPEKLRAQIINNAHDLIGRKFDLSTQTLELTKIYDQLLASEVV